jgi:hypothetical protein
MYVSLKEAIPNIEAAAQRFSTCRGEYRTAVKRVRFSTHKGISAART